MRSVLPTVSIQTMPVATSSVMWRPCSPPQQRPAIAMPGDLPAPVEQRQPHARPEKRPQRVAVPAQADLSHPDGDECRGRRVGPRLLPAVRGPTHGATPESGRAAATDWGTNTRLQRIAVPSMQKVVLVRNTDGSSVICVTMRLSMTASG